MYMKSTNSKKKMQLFFLFIIIFFPILLKSQNLQTPNYIYGNICNRGTKEKLDSIQIYNMNRYSKPLQCYQDSTYILPLYCDYDDGKTFILYYSGRMFCPIISSISLKDSVRNNVSLRHAIYPPKTLEIHIKGYVTDSKGRSIDSAQVFLHEGINTFSTDSTGYFDIIADKGKQPIAVSLSI